MTFCGSRSRRNLLSRFENFPFGDLKNSMGLEMSEFVELENLVYSPIPFIGVATLEKLDSQSFAV